MPSKYMSRSTAENMFLVHVSEMGAPVPLHKYRVGADPMLSVDFAWIDSRLAVDINSSRWIGRSSKACKSCGGIPGGNAAVSMMMHRLFSKQVALACRGWSYMVFTPTMIRQGADIRSIKMFFGSKDRSGNDGPRTHEIVGRCLSLARDRKMAKISQSKLAEAAGCSQLDVSHIECVIPRILSSGMIDTAEQALKELTSGGDDA